MNNKMKIKSNGITKTKSKFSASRFFIYLILTVGAFISILPFIWMILTSFKNYHEVIARKWIPSSIRFSNYVIAWNMAPFPRYFANTFLVATATVIGVLITSILAGYAFARMDFFGKNAIFILFLSTMMIPFQIILIPNFIIIKKLGLYNTYLAMIIPWIGSVFSIFLFKQFFTTIPEDYFDAATLDGCSHFRFLLHIALPLSKPILITVALLNFIWSWNSFLWPLIITSEEKMRPIQVGLSYFTIEAGTNAHQLMAAATLTIFPIVLLYFFVQKQFIEGVKTAGLKG